MIRLLHGGVLLAAALLAGCGAGDEDELRQWVSSERAQAKPRVKPLTEPKKFAPESYQLEGSPEPFNIAKLTQAIRRESSQSASNAALIGPEMARKKEPLESYPLDVMAMVGSLNKKSKPTALLRVDNLLYPVVVGNYLGQNYGKIVSIGEASIELREIVQDASGEWTERMTTLELQEGNKK